VLNALIFRMQVFLFKKIIRGRHAWTLFNQAGIEGFGVNLVRFYFPLYYDKQDNRESFSPEVKQQIAAMFEASAEKYNFNNAITAALPELLKLAAAETDKTMPYLDNYYFGLYDAAALAVVIGHFKPSKILEIGSGISTRYMRMFVDRLSLHTKITCIDPFPRAEIDGVADRVIYEPLERAIENHRFDLQSGDIVFLDGSHYVFQGNDTLTFFFKFMPSLPAGVIIHIHDIYLPYDYSASVAPQLWSEQYIVAAMLLGGFNGYEIVYPVFYNAQTNSLMIEAMALAEAQLKPGDFQLRKDHTAGYSLWIRKV
jgi:hypothetical protein